MTERYGSGYGDEGQRPSGRGAVTERLARQPHGAREIDLTDEAAAREPADDQAGRESSGAFEPAAGTRPGSSSIFDVSDPGGGTTQAADITPTPVPAAEPSTDPPTPLGLPEPGSTDTQAAATTDAQTAPAGGVPGSLLGSLDAGELRNRFIDIQAGFVDEPRQAVEEAGRFVDDLVRQVAEAIERQRGQLAGTSPEGSTEDLRLALRAYRQFVDRLLSLGR